MGDELSAEDLALFAAMDRRQAKRVAREAQVALLTLENRLSVMSRAHRHQEGTMLDPYQMDLDVLRRLVEDWGEHGEFATGWGHQNNHGTTGDELSET